MNSEIEFIKKNFRKYYERKGIVPPSEFEKREFGFGNDKKIDFRHVAFKTELELKNYFVANAPLYASFSTAYYEFPDLRPMERKNFLGADLVFEFDAECTHNKLTCEDCLAKVKQETFKLIEEFLIPDFGFNRKEISVSFSGSRGYHVFVVSDSVKQLKSLARRQIVDYLQSKNIDLKKTIQGATLNSKAWKGKIARAVCEYVKNAKEKKIRERREEILRQASHGNYNLFKGASSFWRKILEKNIVNLSAKVDQTVTLDLSKLVRIPSTIHGGSSLLCTYVSNLEKFNPFTDTVIFQDQPEKIRLLKDTSAICLKNQTFGPFKKEEIKEIPEYAALYLVCKKAAVPA